MYPSQWSVRLTLAQLSPPRRGLSWLVFAEAGVAEAGTPSSSSVGISAVQSGPSAGATSLPVEAVQAGGKESPLSSRCG